MTTAKKEEMIGAGETIALKVVKSKHWRWMSGMLTTEGYRLLSIGKSPGTWEAYNRAKRSIVSDYEPTLPDFDDPPTMGCLLTLTREAWNDPWLGCSASYRRGGLWLVHNGTEAPREFYSRVYTKHATSEIEGLTHALISAPTKLA